MNSLQRLREVWKHGDRLSSAELGRAIEAVLADPNLGDVAAEREACARIVDRWADGAEEGSEFHDVAAAIRARSTTQKEER